MVRARSSAVEHLTFNQVVVGSIPTGLTNDFNGLTFLKDVSQSIDQKWGFNGASPGSTLYDGDVTKALLEFVRCGRFAPVRNAASSTLNLT